MTNCPAGFKVNFLIAGVQKGGTSALAHFLSQHPEICMAPQKEVHFFDQPDFDDALDWNTLNADYAKAFPNYNGEGLVGEATPIYMYLPCLAGRIQRYNSAMKLIVLLRDPAERALSHYYMERNRGQEELPLTLAILVEKFRLWRDRSNVAENSSVRVHSYLDRGFYVRQIKNLLRYFPGGQVLCLKSEELARQHQATLDKVYDFLGVSDRSFVPPRERVLEGQYDKRATRLAQMALVHYYRREIKALERLLSGNFNR